MADVDARVPPDVPRVKLQSHGLEVSVQGLSCLGMSAFYGLLELEFDMIALIRHAVSSSVTFLGTFDLYGPFTTEILLSKGVFSCVFKDRTQGSCDFTGTTIPTQTDPSANGCSFPTSPSAASSTNGNGAGTATATQNPSSSSSTGGFTPTQSGTGLLGGLGPLEATTSIDGSGAASFLLPTQAIRCCFLLLISYFYQSSDTI